MWLSTIYANALQLLRILNYIYYSFVFLNSKWPFLIYYLSYMNKSVSIMIKF